MNDQPNVEEFERKKKLFTFLPLLVVPVLILLFWGLGGGTSAAGNLPDGQYVSNVNTSLPEPIVDRARSKAEVYADRDREAAKRQYALSRDPYAQSFTDSVDVAEYRPAPSDWERRFAARTGDLEKQLSAFSSDVSRLDSPAESKRSPFASGSSATTNGQRNTTPSLSVSSLVAAEEDGLARLRAQTEMEAPSGSGVPSANPFPTGTGSESYYSDALFADDFALTAEDSAANEQLATLDRIMERATMLQYPELAQEELRKRSEENAKQLFPVGEAPSAAGDIRLFGGSGSVSQHRRDSIQPRSRGGFYTDDNSDNGVQHITVRAQIHNTSTVMDGSTVKMRLLEDVFVAGQRVPANTFVYGTCQLRGDRLGVQVETINYRGNIYDVGLSVYDLDGQVGLAVPGSVERQIAKREAARASRSIGGSAAVGGNLATQLAADGAQTIKEVTSRKLSVIKLELKAGHRIILRNN